MKVNFPKKLWTAPEVVQTVLKGKQPISSIQIFYMYYVIAVYYVYFFIIIIIK